MRLSGSRPSLSLYKGIFPPNGPSCTIFKYLTLLDYREYKQLSSTTKKKWQMVADHFLTLTWFDLESWAGPRIVARGKSYQHGGRVNELARTESGDLLAWVDGSRRYATLVSYSGKEIISSCTCPFRMNCKHAVAVVLEYLEYMKKEKIVPLSNEKDERLELIREGDKALQESISNDELNEKEIEDSGSQSYQKRSLEIKRFLTSRSKEKLVEWLISLADRYPKIYSELHDSACLASGSITKLVKATSRDIDRTSAEPGWWNSWQSQGFTPDYSRILSNLKRLLDAGYPDEVVALGNKLFRAGTAQVGQSDDEGQTAMQIADCMIVVFRALQRCSLPDVEKILCALDFELEDEYELCNGLDEFWKKKFKREDWSVVADKMLDRLSHWKPKNGMNSFSRDYNLNCLTDIIIRALKNAGRGREIIPLAMQEASKTHSYERLIKLLRKEGRTDEAEEWIRRGFEATRKIWPGIANHLRQQLIEIRSQRRDLKSVAAIRADEFFEAPSLHSFKDLKIASEKADVWPAVRQKALLFLETGKLPPQIEGGNASEEKSSWPLPSIGLGKKGTRTSLRFPLTDVLIEVAIYEKRVDEVLKWYDIQSQRRQAFWGWEGELDDKVALAIASRYPDRAVDIWKEIAESHIARTKPSEYTEAAKYLRKIQKVMKEQGRGKEWAAYLAKLRVENARKRKFLEVLDRVSGKPIIDRRKIPIINDK